MAAVSDPQTNDEDDKIPTVKQLKLLAYDLYHEKIAKSRLTPEGFGKLKRKVLKELQHLETLGENTCYKSSNIHYLHSIWKTIEEEGKNVCGVFKRYKFISPLASHTASSRKSELIVDIVCDDGLRWIKVKTSNPYSMQLQFLNAGSSSKAKNIVTMAQNFYCAAQQHKVYFRAPKIEFIFVEGITSDLAYILKQKSIIIKGKQIKDDFLYEDDESSDESQESIEVNHNKKDINNNDKLDDTCVNLGVRTMLTMVSSLSNGEINDDFFTDLQESLIEKDRINRDRVQINNIHTNGNGKTHKKSAKTHKINSKNNLDFEYVDYPSKSDAKRVVNKANHLDENGYTLGHKSSFKKKSLRKKFNEKSYEEQKMLNNMYKDEMTNAVLPIIMKCIENKKLVCCETAWNHFMDIMHISAGPNEWKRCAELQKRIIIVKDQISQRTKQLTGKSMSHINKCVFGTGDSMKIITLTAIASFIRKAEQRGVKYFVHIHPVRPLTERYQREYGKKIKQEMKENDDELIKQPKEEQCGNHNNGEKIKHIATALEAVADNEDMLIVD